MQRSVIEQGTHDYGFFAQLPAVLLAGAAIAAIIVVNQPRISAHASAAQIVPAEATLSVDPTGAPSKVAAQPVGPV